MNTQLSSFKFGRTSSAGLVALLLIAIPATVYAQVPTFPITGGDSGSQNSTKIPTIGSINGGSFPITGGTIPTPGLPGISQNIGSLLNSGSGTAKIGILPTLGSSGATGNGISPIGILPTLGSSSAVSHNTSTPATRGATTVFPGASTLLTPQIQSSSAFHSLIAEFTDNFMKAGATPPTAVNTAIVTVAVSEDSSKSLISSIENQGGVANARYRVPVASNLGVLVASTQPVAIAQEPELPTTEQAVGDLYNTYVQAFVASGVNDRDAKRDAKNLVVALAGIKNSIKAKNLVDIKKVNQLAGLIKPSIAALPGMQKALNNNPSAETFHQIKDTVVGLQTVGVFVKTVQDSV
jgi:hypothetical protein